MNGCAGIDFLASDLDPAPCSAAHHHWRVWRFSVFRLLPAMLPFPRLCFWYVCCLPVLGSFGKLDDDRNRDDVVLLRRRIVYCCLCLLIVSGAETAPRPRTDGWLVGEYSLYQNGLSCIHVFAFLYICVQSRLTINTKYPTTII